MDISIYEIKGKKRKDTFSFDVTVTMFIYMFNNNLHLPIDGNRGVVISVSKEVYDISCLYLFGLRL